MVLAPFHAFSCLGKVTSVLAVRRVLLVPVRLEEVERTKICTLEVLIEVLLVSNDHGHVAGSTK